MRQGREAQNGKHTLGDGTMKQRIYGWLKLGRHHGQGIQIGDDIFVKYCSDGLAIKAPKNVPIVRDELIRG